MALDGTWLKLNYGGGLPFVDRNGRPIPESVFATQIAAAVSWVESMMGICITPGTEVDDPYDLTQTRPPWYRTRLKKRPIRELVSAKFQFGRILPAVFICPPSWLWNRDQRFAEIIPDNTAPDAQPVAINYYYYAGVGWGFGNNLMPAGLRWTYTYGYLDGQVPQSIQNAIGYKAMMLVLLWVGNAIQPLGITSRSRSQDSLSQSWGTTASQKYGPMTGQIQFYQDQLNQAMYVLNGEWGGNFRIAAV